MNKHLGVLGLVARAAVVISITAPAAAAQVVQYTTGAYRIADTTVAEGLQAQGANQTFSAGQAPGSISQRAFLKFALPLTAAPISRAELRLFGGDPSNTPGVPTVDVYAADYTAWDELTMLWSEQPPTQPGPLATLVSEGEAMRMYVADVSGYVQSVAGARPSVGGSLLSFALYPAADGVGMTFQSKEGNTSAFNAGLETRPGLKIVTEATPEQFFQQHCQACHGNAGRDTVAGAWEAGTQPLCFNMTAILPNTGDGKPTQIEFGTMRSFVESMINADESHPQGDFLEPLGKEAKAGATTGCYVAQGDCMEMIDPLARYIYTMRCQLPEPPF